jgi:hypothetical protein
MRYKKVLHYLGNNLEQFKNCSRLSLGFHCMIITEARVSLCFSLVVNTTLCQYSFIFDSLTSFSKAFCSFLFLLNSFIFSCCFPFHCSTKDFSFLSFLIIPSSSFTLSLSLLASTLNSGCSSTGAGRFKSMEAQGFLNLISYFEDNPVLRSSSSMLSDSLVSRTSCSWFISRKESFFSSSYVPLSVDSVTKIDLVVSLVTSLLEHCAICFPFSFFFLYSSDSSFNLCKEDARVSFLSSFIVSVELSSMIIRIFLLDRRMKQSL